MPLSPIDYRTLPLSYLLLKEAPLEYEKRKDLEYFWLVDPLDGTKDFVANLSGWSVNIALIPTEKAILGVVYVPMLKELYLGLEGFGAFVGRGDSALGRHSGALSFGLESAIALISRRR